MSEGAHDASLSGTGCDDRQPHDGHPGQASQERGRHLGQGRIGVVPVLTPQGRVAGVVAESDLLRKEQLQRDPDGQALDAPAVPDPPGHRHGRDRGRAHGPLPGDRAGRHASVAEAARLMDRHQSRFLLVTGEDGKLLGVVTARDLLRVFLRPDEAIKAEISRETSCRVTLAPTPPWSRSMSPKGWSG